MAQRGFGACGWGCCQCSYARLWQLPSTFISLSRPDSGPFGRQQTLKAPAVLLSLSAAGQGNVPMQDGDLVTCILELVLGVVLVQQRGVVAQNLSPRYQRVTWRCGNQVTFATRRSAIGSPCSPAQGTATSMPFLTRSRRSLKALVASSLSSLSGPSSNPRR